MSKNKLPRDKANDHENIITNPLENINPVIKQNTKLKIPIAICEIKFHERLAVARLKMYAEIVIELTNQPRININPTITKFTSKSPIKTMEMILRLGKTNPNVRNNNSRFSLKI